jgi:hypothetical protein
MDFELNYAYLLDSDSDCDCLEEWMQDNGSKTCSS